MSCGCTQLFGAADCVSGQPPHKSTKRAAAVCVVKVEIVMVLDLHEL